MEPLTKCRFKVVIAGATGSTSSELSAISIGNLESSMGVAKMKHGSRTLTSRSGAAAASLGRLRIEFQVGSPGWKDIITWWNEVNDFAKKLEKRNIDIIVYDGEEEALQKIHLQAAWPCRYGFQGASQQASSANQTASLIQYLEFIAESFQITATDKVSSTAPKGAGEGTGPTTVPPTKPSVTIKFGNANVKDAFKVSANMRDAFKAEGTLAVGGGIAGAALAAGGHVVGSLLKGNGQLDKLADPLPEQPTEDAIADTDGPKNSPPDSTDRNPPTEAAHESVSEPVDNKPAGAESDNSEITAESLDPSATSAETSTEAPETPPLPEDQSEAANTETGEAVAGSESISPLGMAAATAAIIGAGALHASDPHTNPPITQRLEPIRGIGTDNDASASATADDLAGTGTEVATTGSATNNPLGSATQIAAAGAGIASGARLATTLAGNSGGSQGNHSPEPQYGQPAGSKLDPVPMPATADSARTQAPGYAGNAASGDRLSTTSGPAAALTPLPFTKPTATKAGTPANCSEPVHPTQPSKQIPMQRGPSAGFEPRPKARYTRPISLSLKQATDSTPAAIVVTEEGGESEDTLAIIRDLIEKDLSAKVIRSSWLAPVDAEYRWCGKLIVVTETGDGLHIFIPDDPLRIALFDCLRSRLVVCADSAIK